MSVEFGGRRSDWRRLPEHIRKKIRTDGVDQLETLRAAIQKAAGVPMPPIRIDPWGWVGPLGEIAYGRATLLRHRDGSNQFGIELPASDIIVVEEISLLRKILVHEFNHCFALYTLIIQQMESGNDQLILSDPSLQKAESWEEMAKADNQFHVEPRNWFGEDDAREFLWYDSPEEGVTGLSEVSKKFDERWAQRGLPTKTPDLSFSASEISIPQPIVDRIKEKGERIILPK